MREQGKSRMLLSKSIPSVIASVTISYRALTLWQDQARPCLLSNVNGRQSRVLAQVGTWVLRYLTDSRQLPQWEGGMIAL